MAEIELHRDYRLYDAMAVLCRLRSGSAFSGTSFVGSRATAGVVRGLNEEAGNLKRENEATFKMFEQRMLQMEAQFEAKQEQNKMAWMQIRDEAAVSHGVTQEELSKNEEATSGRTAKN